MLVSDGDKEDDVILDLSSDFCVHSDGEIVIVVILLNPESVVLKWIWLRIDSPGLFCTLESDGNLRSWVEKLVESLVLRLSKDKSDQAFLTSSLFQSGAFWEPGLGSDKLTISSASVLTDKIYGHLALRIERTVNEFFDGEFVVFGRNESGKNVLGQLAIDIFLVILNGEVEF